MKEVFILKCNDGIEGVFGSAEKAAQTAVERKLAKSNQIQELVDGSMIATDLPNGRAYVKILCEPVII